MPGPVKDTGPQQGIPAPGRCGLCQIHPCGPVGCPWPDDSAPADDKVQQIDMCPDQTVLDCGLPAGQVWILRAGLLRVQRQGADRRRQILSLALPGEVVGFDLQKRQGLRIETATACSLCRIERSVFEQRLAQSADLCHAMYLQQIDQLDRLRWLTWAIAALCPQERLCAFLVLATRFMPYLSLSDGNGILTMRLSRQDLADLLAIPFERLSHIIHHLILAGIMVQRDPQHFQITDMVGLRARGRIDQRFATLPFGRMMTRDRPDSAAIAVDVGFAAKGRYPRLVRFPPADP